MQYRWAKRMGSVVSKVTPTEKMAIWTRISSCGGGCAASPWPMG